MPLFSYNQMIQLFNYDLIPFLYLFGWLVADASELTLHRKPHFLPSEASHFHFCPCQPYLESAPMLLTLRPFSSCKITRQRTSMPNALSRHTSHCFCDATATSETQASMQRHGKYSTRRPGVVHLGIPICSLEPQISKTVIVGTV